ncbi:MAG: hypothetical protein R3Y24_04130 [Eubacteriales bacterium]
MMYPFMQLDDNTEIVHSDYIIEADKEFVKVYIEKPIEDGFKNIVCYLPEYRWEKNNGFSEKEIDKYREILESTAHLIIRFSKERGFENASNF